jgi:hypothetical protein
MTETSRPLSAGMRAVAKPTTDHVRRNALIAVAHDSTTSRGRDAAPPRHGQGRGRRHIADDRQPGPRGPGPGLPRDGLDGGADDAARAYPRADGTGQRTRGCPPGTYCHDDRRRGHRPRRGNTGPPASQQPGRNRHRDADAEGLARKLIADRHRATQTGSTSECQRRGKQRTVCARPHQMLPSAAPKRKSGRYYVPRSEPHPAGGLPDDHLNDPRPCPCAISCTQIYPLRRDRHGQADRGSPSRSIFRDALTGLPADHNQRA